MRSEQINEIATALSKAQGVMENAVMNKTNPHFRSKYADLSSVRDALRKPLFDNGIAVAQTVEVRETGMVLVTTLYHTSGQWISSEYPLPTTARPQELGSALTYARRYSLAAIVCNSSDEDDDGNAAEKDGQKIDATGKATKPSSMKASAPPPVPSTPQAIPTIAVDGVGIDWLGWGSQFVAAISSATSHDAVAQWEKANDINLRQCEKEAVKVYERIVSRIAAQRASFDKGDKKP